MAGESELLKLLASAGLIAGTGGLTAIPMALQLGTGIAQMIQGRKLGKTERPEYEIPESIKQALASSQSLASLRELPSQGIIEDKLRGSTASAVENLKQTGGAGALGAIAGLYGGEQGQIADLGVAGDQMWLQNQRSLQNMLSNYAGYEDKAYKINELDPYLQKMQQAAQLKTAGLSNLMGSAQGVVNTAMGLSQIGSINNLANPQDTSNNAVTPNTTQNISLNASPTMPSNNLTFEDYISQLIMQGK